MEEARRGVEARIMERLRAAGEPVREAVLYERVRGEGSDMSPDLFLAALERLATTGHLHVAVEHDLPARDPAPFQPRMWYVVE
jgi:hypothetical protein